uniref:DUF19 domain-containing protein n=1 Tax=Rhabditophanes sp. KR3021 TaxID=114890 RepID=A0AC35UEU3_9BILA
MSLVKFVLVSCCLLIGQAIGGISRETLINIACKRNPTLAFCVLEEGARASGATSEHHSTTSSHTNLRAGSVDKLTTTSINNSTASSINNVGTSSIADVVNALLNEINATTALPTTNPIPPKFIPTTNPSASEIDRSPERKTIDETTDDGWRHATSIDGQTDPETVKSSPSKVDAIITKKSISPTIDNESGFGSLLRLPKPVNISTSNAPPIKQGESKVSKEDEEVEKELSKLKKEVSELKKDDEEEVEDSGSSVLVFVTKFCVLQRAAFIDKCRGEVKFENLDFCKSYPLACQANDKILPVIMYCDKFKKHNAKYCIGEEEVDGEEMQTKVTNFCLAYKNVCVNKVVVDHDKFLMAPPRSNFVKCSDIKDKAKQMCDPFPDKRDKLNFARCSQFIKSCREYADWL